MFGLSFYTTWGQLDYCRIETGETGHVDAFKGRVNWTIVELKRCLSDGEYKGAIRGQLDYCRIETAFTVALSRASTVGQLDYCRIETPHQGIVWKRQRRVNWTIVELKRN
ncbi:MAG: hypothetical protein EZS28_019938 [Streblomastix strix]|uniref:Uncharacterized protein n=1 Tax=Streblomastix strix TaxID=222440 RepID=A0A5J4VQK2_9EUKA|nr:MAG: hypothetical protein EZS28_019938 [Streblomastix strix]